MEKIYNFSAGPAMLPDEVMQEAQAEFRDWRGMGVSVMEVSHRSREFVALVEEIEQDLRDILSIPNNYRVLFLHGGANTQFSAIPMNFLDDYTSAAYVVTGFWGKKAAKEAARYTSVNMLVNTESTGFNTLPPFEAWGDFSDAAYLYYVDNETINGVEFPFVPKSGEVPLICDMSSNLLSRAFDITKFDFIVACAQKNLGMAGVTLVIVKDDLLARKPMPTTPTMLDYREQVKNNSMVNTPPTYAWYMAGKVFKWVKSQGGLETIANRNKEKAQKLYAYVDETDFYVNKVEKYARSQMNVPFHLPTPELDALFVEKALTHGLYGLKGHRLAGGIRASIYNAMPMAGVDKLIAFMQDFIKTNG